MVQLSGYIGKIRKNISVMKSIGILLILLLGCLSLTWFRGDNLIGGGDFGMPLDWGKYLKLMPFVWDETVSFGHADYRQVASLIPDAILGAGLEKLGFSLVAIEKIFFYLWFTAAGISMSYLCRVLGMRRQGRLAASIFYMLNPFSLIIIWLVSHGRIQSAYAFAPLVLGLFINGLKNQKNLRYIIGANFIWLLTAASAYANPRMMVIHWLIIGFFFFWHLIFANKSQRRWALRYAGKFFAVWLLLHAYWLLPFLLAMRESFVSAHSIFLMPDIEQLKLTSVRLVEAIRMLGYWSMKSGYHGDPYYQYWQYYDLTWIKLISWLIPILVISGLWQQKKQDKVLAFFLLSLAICGLIGINGAYPPLGGLVVWLCGLLPLLNALSRFNFLFCGVPTYLVFTVLLGYGCQKINKFFLGPLLLLLSVVLVWPFWNGEVIRAEGRSFPGERFQVPADWLEAKNWLAGQRDFFRILPLPMSKTYNVAFDWEKGYSGGDPTRWFTSQPVVNANTGQSFDLVMALGEAIEKKTNFQNISNLLGFLNVKYLLVRGDTRWEFLTGHSWWFYQPPESINQFIKNQPALSLAKEINKLKFYQLDNDYLLSRFYAVQKLIVIDSASDGLLALAQFLAPEKKEAFLLSQDQAAEFIWRQPSEPGVYQVNVVQAGDYQFLFADDGWLRFYQDNKIKLKIDDGQVEERVFTPSADNLLSLGQVRLTAGEHQLTFFPAPAINLIKIPGGHQTFKITAVDKEKTVTLALNDFRIGDNYQLSFRARHVQGKPAGLVIWENYTEASEPVFQELNLPFGSAKTETNYSLLSIEISDSWQDVRFNFQPSAAAKKVGLAFVATPELITKTENWFDQVRVERIFDNPLILRNLSPEDRVIAIPQVSWQKINPTKYKIEIKNAREPFWLVFSEAFHPGWRISISAKGGPASGWDGDHQMINGFANGWYLTKTGDYQLDVSFSPQKYFYLGSSISLFTLLLSLVYLARCYLFRF